MSRHTYLRALILNTRSKYLYLWGRAFLWFDLRGA